MKKCYFLFVFLLCCHTIWAQQVAWERTYGTSSTLIKQCEPLPDGGFALLLLDGFNVSAARLDSAGNEIWNEPVGGGGYISDYDNCFIKPVEGGLLAGMCQIGSDTVPILLVKYNWQGTELWRKNLRTGRSINSPWDLHIRSANEYLLLASGYNLNQPGDGAKYIAFSIDSTGAESWRKNYFEDSLGYGYPRNIINYRNNGYLFCGEMGLNGHHPYFMKIDELGMSFSI